MQTKVDFRGLTDKLAVQKNIRYFLYFSSMDKLMYIDDCNCICSAEQLGVRNMYFIIFCYLFEFNSLNDLAQQLIDTVRKKGAEVGRSQRFLCAN
jgi:hypothetical protein